MKFLVLSCLLGLALAGQTPSFRYASKIALPQDGARSESAEDQTWYEFNERNGPNYSWGYHFPGRAHSESKDAGGNVRGTIGFLDANENMNVWKYRSDPRNGFKVEIEVEGSNPQASQPAQTALEEPTAIFYSVENESKRQQFYDRYDLSPQLKSAVDSRQIYAAGSSPFSGNPQFYVDHRQVEQLGSVSAVAEQFGAIPVAAVHDVQSRPGYASQASSSPVLNFKDGLYTIEVPEPAV